MQETPNLKNIRGGVRARSLASMSLFLALIIIGGYITIDIGTVPFSMQIVVVILAATLLKPAENLAMIFIYILMGLLGLPVFASKAASGVAYLLMPSFGFLIGFLLGAPLISFVSNLGVSSPKYMQILLACLLGLIIIYIAGVIYMVVLTRFYFGENTKIWILLKFIVVMFLPKDLFFCLLIPILTKRLKAYFSTQI